MALVNGVEVYKELNLYRKHELVEMGSMDIQEYEFDRDIPSDDNPYTYWLIVAMPEETDPDNDYIVVYACDADGQYDEGDEPYMEWAAGEEGRMYERAVEDAKRGALIS